MLVLGPGAYRYGGIHAQSVTPPSPIVSLVDEQEDVLTLFATSEYDLVIYIYIDSSYIVRLSRLAYKKTTQAVVSVLLGILKAQKTYGVHARVLWTIIEINKRVGIQATC